jgi:hypothetical protein
MPESTKATDRIERAIELLYAAMAHSLGPDLEDSADAVFQGAA